MHIPRSGELYRHFKNKLYQIVTVAEHSESGERLVIYQAMYGEFKIYARPLEMFVSKVDTEKYPEAKQEYRFEKVGTPTISDKYVIPQEKPEVIPVEEPSSEVGPEEGLMDFLDTNDWDLRYNILVSLRDKMTDKLVDDLAVALDVVIPDGPLEKRYEQLKVCLRTRQKYESRHLR